MTRFFLFGVTFLTLFMVTFAPVSAMGINDFVAVATGPSGAIANPAGLASLDSNIVNWEHRFDGRDLAGGWDDLAVYAATGEPANGAAFWGYSQDVTTSIDIYRRVSSFGYAAGWKALDHIAVGLTGKFNTAAFYSNSSGMMVRDNSSMTNLFLVDFGMLIEPSLNLKAGFVIHNLGRDEQKQVMNYQSAIGFSYQIKPVILAVEIDDFLNEGGSFEDEGSYLRLGCRFDITPQLMVHLVREESDWGFSGQNYGIEYISKDKLNFTVARYMAQSDFFASSTTQASIGYHF